MKVVTQISQKAVARGWVECKKNGWGDGGEKSEESKKMREKICLLMDEFLWWG